MNQKVDCIHRLRISWKLIAAIIVPVALLPLVFIDEGKIGQEEEQRDATVK